MIFVFTLFDLDLVHQYWAVTMIVLNSYPQQLEFLYVTLFSKIVLALPRWNMLELREICWQKWLATT